MDARLPAYTSAACLLRAKELITPPSCFIDCSAVLIMGPLGGEDRAAGRTIAAPFAKEHGGSWAVDTRFRPDFWYALQHSGHDFYDFVWKGSGKK